METLPGVAPPEQQSTYFYIGQHETKRTVPVTTELGNQAQDAGVSFINLTFYAFCMFWNGLGFERLLYDFILGSAVRDCDYEYILHAKPEDHSKVNKKEHS